MKTKVDGKFGRKVKVFGSSNTYCRGFRSSYSSAGYGKQLSAIVAASASGRKIPTFFVFAGKNGISSWIEPLSDPCNLDMNGNPHLAVTKGWFPQEVAMFPSENCSMETTFLLLLVEHVDLHVRKAIGPEKTFFISLDVHSSRNAYDWLELCVAKT